jgi:predicted transcriptional regulator of viral defense system
MKSLGIFKEHPNFKGNAFILLGRTDENAGEVACTVDPFSYLSHLSAMEYHGLTDRVPIKLYLSSPSSMTWKKEAYLRMKADLGEDNFIKYEENNLPLLRKTKFIKVKKREISCFNSSHRGAFIKVRDKNMRVSSLGRTFLDMLRNPDLCGGMKHVVNVFEEHALDYLPLIVDEINQHGKAVEKVRAGYILEEICAIKNEAIASWSEFAQRGGSRKLDASAEYIPKWSEKWKISLNLF